ncbi:acyl transferase domain-containing protein/thioesterase domain-containing protein/acyl carrier protein, partial [Kitasatospora sp. MAA19]|nr:acyl transferase domain-containing protein/thioesterase domain-containing protein/acyl carrier protein [Kitasatospora sp. MAA19]
QPSEVDAVEAHGTGTRLGDPIEAQALQATYGQDRQQPLWLGSVKSNIGHTQAAAGAAGIIKMILAMQHGVLPRTLHIDEPTPHVDWTAGAVSLLTEQQPWPAHDRPRRAAVSSFGISGTNAHVILEQPPVTDSRQAPPQRTLPCVPVTVSGHTPAALRAQAAQLADRDDASVLDVAYSLATTRTALEHRAVIVATDPADHTQALRALARGGSHPGLVTGRGDRGTLAMVFSGQGSQRLGMGRELYDTYPVYADAFDTACTELDPHLPHPLRDIVFSDDETLLNQTQYTQPALFALQVALYRLWEHWGITPDVITGHSIGEIAAAHITGILTLTDAATLITHRAHLMQALPEGGAMVAITTTEDDIRPLLHGHEHHAGIAAINSPTSLVLSGDHTTLTEIIDKLDRHRTTWLRVSHAFHSPLMEPILDELRTVISQLTLSPPAIPLISTLTGQPIDHTDPEHWIRHARHTVRFADAITHTPADTYLEIGPSASLTPHLPTNTIASLNPKHSDTRSLTTALAHLTAHGANPHWDHYFTNTGAQRTPLPTYPFQHTRYWLDNRPSDVVDLGAAGLDSSGHALVTSVIADPESGGLMFLGRIGADAHSWLADHVVAGRMVLPGTAYVDLLLHAGAACGLSQLDDLTLEAPLVIPRDTPIDVRMTVEPPDAAGRRTVRVHSRGSDPDSAWNRNARAVLTAPAAPSAPSVPDGPGEWPPPDAQPLDLASVYPTLAAHGLDYGPVFQGLRHAWSRPGELFAETALPEGTDVTGHVLHPALLDAALHAIGFGGLVDAGETGPRLPFAWRGVQAGPPGATTLRVRLAVVGPDTVTLQLFDGSGRVIGSVDALTLRGVPADHPSTTAPRSLLDVRWQDLPPAPDAQPSWWVMLGEDGLGLASLLRGVGGRIEEHADLAGLTTAVAASGATPDAVFLAPTAPEGSDVPTATARLASQVLAFLRTWLTDQRFAGTRLVLVTRDATTDPVAAALAGLVRAAEAEHPGRLAVVDIGSGTDRLDRRVLAAALASGEPHVTLRGGAAQVPRFAALAASDPAAVDLSAGTVLVTGASGALGRLVTRHLVDHHGVRDLLLVNRSGEMAGLRAELESAGATVEVAACDVAERDQVAALLSSRPVRAVVHAAGVLDDGVIESLTDEQLSRVLRPKLDGAWNLHELTGDTTLLVLFSSIAGILGSAGQAAYAAANSALDALAAHRTARGLPALSLAWGPWTTEIGMSAGRRRLERAGVVPLSPEEALALFDVALTRPEPLLVPVHPDLAALSAAAQRHQVPPIWHGLVRPPAKDAPRAGQDASPRFGQLSADERDRQLLGLVRREVATVLGYSSVDTLDGELAFSELGFDSLTAVDLRNRLEQATGLRLPASLVFDHPTAPDLVRFLSAEFGSAAPESTDPQDTLGALFTEACEQGRMDEGIELVSLAARFRPAFRTPEELGRRPHPVPLSRGSAEPMLLCFPAVVAMSGAHQYARFAAALRDSRSTVVLPEPGFVAGEKLPADVTALVDVQAQAVLEQAAGAPYALLGYSSGGWIAHEVARRLAETDAPPSGVVLLDTYLPREMNPRLNQAFTHGLFARRSELVSTDHVSLTAMGGYFSVFGAWEPQRSGVPTLFLRAADALPDADGKPLPDCDWGPEWAHCDTDLEISGDHFTIVSEHAESTARTVDAWLGAL